MPHAMPTLFLWFDEQRPTPAHARPRWVVGCGPRPDSPPDLWSGRELRPEAEILLSLELFFHRKNFSPRAFISISNQKFFLQVGICLKIPSIQKMPNWQSRFDFDSYEKKVTFNEQFTILRIKCAELFQACFSWGGKIFFLFIENPELHLIC